MKLLKGTPRKTGRTTYEAETMAMRDDVDAKFEAWKNGGSEQAYRNAADAFNARCSSEEYFADNALANQMDAQAKFSARSFTVYDSELETGEILRGGYILAAVFVNKDEADQVLEKYRADNRYDVRPSGAGAVAEAAQEIAARA